MKTNITMPNKNFVRIVVLTAVILLVPLMAMQFTNEVDWGLEDFVVGGVLLIGTGLIYELIVRKMENVAYRAVVGVGLVVALLLIWAQLAVGIIGD
jgi:hypothetical protein